VGPVSLFHCYRQSIFCQASLVGGASGGGARGPLVNFQEGPGSSAFGEPRGPTRFFLAVGFPQPSPHQHPAGHRFLESLPLLARPPPPTRSGAPSRLSQMPRCPRPVWRPFCDMSQKRSHQASQRTAGCMVPRPCNRGHPPHQGNRSPRRGRQADILPIAWDKGTDVCVDLTIASPLGLDVYPLNLQKVRRHQNNIEKEKRTKQISECEAVGWGHHPSAYSPWGGQGSQAKKLPLRSSQTGRRRPRVAQDAPDP